MDERRKEAKLSQGLLDLKFMKRTREKIKQEEEAEETHAMYGHLITDEMKNNDHIIFREVSIAFCKNLVDGRLSFGGMNPKIEKLMENDYHKKISEADRMKEKDVTDEQMAKNYSSLVNTMGSKFKHKKSKNKTYVKPSAEEPLA